MARKLTQVDGLLDGLRTVIADATEAGLNEIDTAVIGAYTAGGAEAAVIAASLNPGLVTAATMGPIAPTKAAQDRLKAAATAADRGLQRNIARAYRTTVAETVAAASGGITRRQAAQAALNRLTTQGVMTVRDASGRTWRASSYIEMAARTELAHAHTKGATDRYKALDEDLVIVSDSPEECDDCAPWEGEVLSLTGRTRNYPTLDEAEADGLMHPNCTHSVSLYQEGVTKRRRPQRDPAAYEARQELRRHERQVRAAKERLAVAVTPEAKTEANSLLRTRQANLRAHVASTGAKRQPHRETLNAR